jgi:DNA polymerase I
MKKKLIIVDISSFIFRAFYAIRPLSSPDGIPVNAVHGVWNMVFKLLSQYSPTHIVMARDTGEKTFRHELYDEYKANRTEVPEDLIPQFSIIHELVECMKLANQKKIGFEADDVIGTICTQWKDDFDEILIATGDKDLMQFVDEKVKIVDTMKDVIYDREGVFKKMNVWPEQIVDYLSIVGDTSDNIPGMRGIGAKGAAKLLEQYKTLEACIENKSEMKGKRLNDAFENHVEDALLSKRLIKIHTEVELDITPSDSINSFGPNPELETFFERYGFKSALKKIKDIEYQNHIASENNDSLSVNEPVQVFKILEFDKDIFLSELKKMIRIQSLISIYLDFDQADVTTRKLTSGYMLIGNDVVKFSQEFSEKVLSEVNDVEVFTEHGKRLVDYFNQNKIILSTKVYDVTQLHYLINQNAKHDLGSMVEEYLGRGLAKIDKKQSDLEVGDFSQQISLRLKACFELGEHLVKEASEREVLDVYNNIDFPLFSVLSEMEGNGILLNVKYMQKYQKDLEKEIAQIEIDISKLYDGEINLRSSKQVGELLFEQLNLPAKKKTKTGYSTDSSVLEDLKSMGVSEVPGLLLMFREIDKLLSTYVKALPELISSRTKRIHTNFSQHTAATGRLSSLSPNLQNIPIRNESGRKVRKAFIAGPGCLLLSADYSQVELRLLAHFSGDETMVSAFKNNKDIHAQTAAEVNGISIEDVTSQERSKAKAVNFGLMYGQSSFGLSNALKISRSEAKEYITKYFERFGEVKGYLDTLKEKAEDTGFAITYHGRKRFVPDIRSNNRTIKSQAERVAINSPIQGTAADIIKISMANIAARMKKENLQSKMLLQVHDELIFEVVESELQAMKKLVREEMEGVVELKVPLTVDIGYGVDWYNLK